MNGEEGCVMGNQDLVQLILHHAQLSPVAFVAASRVSKTWHTVCKLDDSLVRSAAKNSGVTKTVLMGLFAMSSDEVNRLPRTTKRRWGGGIIYIYSVGGVEEAWGVVGGVDRWHVRLSKRCRDQRSIETAFGPEWRTLRWPRRYAL